MALPPDLPRVPLTAVVIRVVQAGLDPLGTEGSLKAGGRWNPPNEFGALYTSLEAATAAKEVARGLRQRGIDPTAFPPDAWWAYELEVMLDRVIDLTNPDVLQTIGVSQDSLTGPDLDIAREIAGQARERGYEALLVPSAADPGSKNLVMFVDRLTVTPNVLSSRPVSFGEEAS